MRHEDGGAYLPALVEHLGDLQGDVLGVRARRAEEDVGAGGDVVERLDAGPVSGSTA